MKMSIRASEILVAVRSQTAPERRAIPTLLPKDTGLPMAVCLPVRDLSSYRQSRIKVSSDHGRRSNPNRLVDVSISDDPTIMEEGWLPQHDIRLVRAWILLNRDILRSHWNRDLSTTDMLAALRPLGQPKGWKWARRHDRRAGKIKPTPTLAATIMKSCAPSHLSKTQRPRTSP